MIEAIQLETQEVFANLVPAIRSQEEVKRRGDVAREKQRGGIPAIDFIGGAKIVLLVDTADTLVWVDQPLFEAIGLGASALDLAVQNLRKRTRSPLELTPLHADLPTTFRLSQDDALATGRILLHDLFAAVRGRVEGELLVRVATPKTVLVCTNRNQDIAFVDHLANTLAEEEGAVSRDFLVWTPQSWGQVDVPPSSSRRGPPERRLASRAAPTNGSRRDSADAGPAQGDSAPRVPRGAPKARARRRDKPPTVQGGDDAGSELASPAILDWLKPLEHVGVAKRTGPKQVGGKASTLGKLTREGFPVPRGWVIPARHFTRAVEETLPAGHDVASLVKLAVARAGVERAARAQDRILTQPLPQGLSAAIDALWRAVEGEAPWGLAARSSATCEDDAQTSLAGLATSALGLRGRDEIEQGVRRVWASAFSPRALLYLAHAGIKSYEMAVVLQVMVRAEAAGVMFTAPPPGLEGENFGRDERVVYAARGLGAPVVDGASAADFTRFGPTGVVISQMIAEKPTSLVVGDHGLEIIHRSGDDARAPALDADAIADLAALATDLDRALGRGLDVEFAVERARSDAPWVGRSRSEAPRVERPLPDAPRGERSRVFVLQARPLTGGGYPDGGDAQTVWSRTNLGEALPGPATPLTWSIASAFADHGFREAFGALGCSVPRNATLVANVQGRFYLNLTAFMRIAAQVPGLTPRALLSASGGATESVVGRLEEQTADVSKRGFLMRLPVRGPREIARQARLPAEVAAYEQEAERSLRVLLDLDLSLLPDDALATTLKTQQRLLDRTGGLMLACASASLAAHIGLSRLLERGVRKSTPHGAAISGDPLRAAAAVLAHALAGGVRELESAGPGLELARVAEIARSERDARVALTDGARTLAALPDGPTRAAMHRFLERFGDRAVREAELATPRWREEPAPVLAMLASAIHAPPGEAERALARARAHADAELAHLEQRVSSVELAVIRALVERTQRFTRLRERMRSWVTRVLGMLRVVALDVDRRLRRIDATLPPRAVFFCTFDELTAALASGRAELGAVVRLRRAEHLRDASRPDPAATFVGRPTSAGLPPAVGVALVGLAASGGVVEGRARVLPPGEGDLDAVRPGEILVSRTTDIGLSPLFLVAAGVVTELGGPLSHAAVIAREYGIPAVVSVPGATTSIRTGDRIRVDGDRGVVHRVDELTGRSMPPPSIRDPFEALTEIVE